MLDRKLVIAGLLAKPELKRRAAYYRRKIDNTLSFAFQSQNGLPTDVTVDAVWGYRLREERLRLLDTALTSAIGLLKEKERAVIELTFFKGYTCTQVASYLGVDENTRYGIFRQAIRPLGRTMEMLGLGSKRFLSYFDDEELLINSIERWKTEECDA